MSVAGCLAGLFAAFAVVLATKADRAGTRPTVRAAADRLHRRLTRGKRAAAARAAVVELVRSMAAELRAGRAPEQAFVRAAGAVNRSALDLTGSIAAVAEGTDVATALAALAAEPSQASAGLRPLTACCALSARTGASLSAALDELAGSLREELRLAEEVRAQLAGPRSTVRLLAGLPVLALLLGGAMGAEPCAFLLGSVPGAACLVVAAGLEWAGIAWTRNLIGKALPARAGA